MRASLPAVWRLGAAARSSAGSRPATAGAVQVADINAHVTATTQALSTGYTSAINYAGNGVMAPAQAFAINELDFRDLVPSIGHADYINLIANAGGAGPVTAQQLASANPIPDGIKVAQTQWMMMKYNAEIAEPALAGVGGFDAPGYLAAQPAYAALNTIQANPANYTDQQVTQAIKAALIHLRTQHNAILTAMKPVYKAIGPGAGPQAISTLLAAATYTANGWGRNNSYGDMKETINKVAVAASAQKEQKHIARLLSDNGDASITHLWLKGGVAGAVANNLNILHSRIAAKAAGNPAREAEIRLTHVSIALAAANAILSVGPAGLNAAQAAGGGVRLQHIEDLADHLEALAAEEERLNSGAHTGRSDDLREKARQLRML